MAYTEEEFVDVFDAWASKKAAKIHRLKTTKPSPKSFGVGDEVVVIYPPSKYFQKTGMVEDLDYLPSSASKGYGDYTTTVRFPDGARRKFLIGRVAPSSYLDSKANRAFLSSKKKHYLTRRTDKKETELKLTAFEKKFGPRSTWDQTVIDLFFQKDTPAEAMVFHPDYKLIKKCEEEGVPYHIIRRLTEGIERVE